MTRGCGCGTGLRHPWVFLYKNVVLRGVNAEFTMIRDLGDMKRTAAMSTRPHFRAMTREAEEASSGAALVLCKLLGGLLLLSVP